MRKNTALTLVRARPSTTATQRASAACARSQPRTRTAKAGGAGAPKGGGERKGRRIRRRCRPARPAGRARRQKRDAGATRLTGRALLRASGGADRAPRAHKRAARQPPNARGGARGARAEDGTEARATRQHEDPRRPRAAQSRAHGGGPQRARGRAPAGCGRAGACRAGAVGGRGGRTTRRAGAPTRRALAPRQQLPASVRGSAQLVRRRARGAGNAFCATRRFTRALLREILNAGPRGRRTTGDLVRPPILRRSRGGGPPEALVRPGAAGVAARATLWEAGVSGASSPEIPQNLQ